MSLAGGLRLGLGRAVEASLVRWIGLQRVRVRRCRAHPHGSDALEAYDAVVVTLVVQHHPEANPGPSDANYLFEQFADMMTYHNSGNGAR